MGPLQVWTLESRLRYATVWTLLNGACVLGIMALSGLSRIEVLFAIPAGLVGFLVHGWIWYPRTKRRVAARRG